MGPLYQELLLGGIDLLELELNCRQLVLLTLQRTIGGVEQTSGHAGGLCHKHWSLAQSLQLTRCT
jgi:hypothetical protein